jgi:hypothetical protein
MEELSGMATGVINQTYGLMKLNRGLTLLKKMTDYFGCPFKILNNILRILIFAITEMIAYFVVQSH